MFSLVSFFALLHLCFTPAFSVNLREPIREPDLPLAALEQILGRRPTLTPNKNVFAEIQGRNSTEEILNSIISYGLEKSNNLFDVQEPELYRNGNYLSKDDPGALLAAFNYQMKEAKQLSKYGYATLGASSLVAKRLKLTRNDLSALARISLRQTRLFEECPLKSDNVVCPPYSRLYRTIDGTCNNLAHPTWGAAMRPFVRFLPPEYKDGIESLRESVDRQPLPSPRLISALIHRNAPSPPSQFSTMLMQWGQFVDHDLTLIASTRGFNGSIPKCCTSDGTARIPYGLTHPDCLPIEVPPNDQFYSKHGIRCLEFVRSTPAPHDDCSLGPRDQINQITSFLDASNVYGSSESEASALRLYKLGKLKYKDLLFRKALLPSLDHFLEGECRPTSKNMYCFRGGDVRTNEQPGLASMHTLWMREHNRIAVRLFELNPHWSDERLYHEARRIVAAEMQQITYNEWLPLILGDKVMEVFGLKLIRSGYYYGYNNTVNPTSANSFGTAAFRFGHSLVPTNLIRCDKWHSQLKINVSLRRELMDPGAVHNMGAVDRLMLGLTSQQAMKRDEFIVEELTNHLFQTPKKPFGMDLISINIQRGRDHGLPPYVVWRENCGLTPIVNWGQLLSIMDDDTVGRLRIAYRNVEDIDLFPGGMAEKPVIGGIVGPTFACILGQQFLNLRQGDRFWYELGEQPSSFTEAQLRELRKVTLSRILCDNLDDIETVQPWVFLIPDNEVNPRVSCRSVNIPVANLDAWKEAVRARPVNLHAHAPDFEDISLSDNSVDGGDLISSPEPEEPPVRMPLPKREDDPVDEIPQPIRVKDLSVEKRSINVEKMRGKLGEVEGVYEKFDLFRAHAFNNKLFYGRR